MSEFLDVKGAAAALIGQAQEPIRAYIKTCSDGN
jgi:hypothetical protein